MAVPMAIERNRNGFLIGISAAAASVLLAFSVEVLDIFIQKLRRTVLGPEHSGTRFPQQSAGNDPIGQPLAAGAKQRTGT